MIRLDVVIVVILGIILIYISVVDMMFINIFVLIQLVVRFVVMLIENVVFKEFSFFVGCYSCDVIIVFFDSMGIELLYFFVI